MRRGSASLAAGEGEEEAYVRAGARKDEGVTARGVSVARELVLVLNGLLETIEREEEDEDEEEARVALRRPPCRREADRMSLMLTN